MTENILTRLVGRVYALDIGEGLTIQVVALDARRRWTWKEVLVSPDGGKGQTWVPLAALTELSPPPEEEPSP